MNLDTDVDTDTGLETVSLADLETYSEALLFAEAGTEALVISQIKSDAELSAEINAEVDGWWDSVKSGVKSIFGWGGKKARETKQKVKDIVPKTVKGNMNKLKYEARGLNVSTVSKMISNMLKG